MGSEPYDGGGRIAQPPRIGADPPRHRPSFAGILLYLLRSAGATYNVRRILFEQVPDTLVGIILTLARLGILPLLAGYLLLQFGLKKAQITPFSLGLSFILIGAGLLLKAAVEWVLPHWA